MRRSSTRLVRHAVLQGVAMPNTPVTQMGTAIPTSCKSSEIHLGLHGSRFLIDV
jgi:hypothetical protein